MKSEAEVKNIYDNLLKCISKIENSTPELKADPINQKELETLYSNKYLLELILD